MFGVAFIVEISRWVVIHQFTQNNELITLKYGRYFNRTAAHGPVPQ
jgi:hypothetical protein